MFPAHQLSGNRARTYTWGPLISASTTAYACSSLCRAAVKLRGAPQVARLFTATPTALQGSICTKSSFPRVSLGKSSQLWLPIPWLFSDLSKQSTTAAGLPHLAAASSTTNDTDQVSATQTNSDIVETNDAGTSSASDQLIFKAAACVLPHPDKIGKGGEDAYFIADDGLALGIADGVGAWVERNIDPAIYSRLLMRNAEKAAKGIEHSPDAPRKVLSVTHKETKVMGSSTACVVLLQGSKLRAANLGDSGFMVMRNDKYILQSPQQQHSFNCPFQLSSEAKGTDTATDAEGFELEARKDDVVVMATDGVLDNVFPQESEAIVSILRKKGHSPSSVAEGLARFAQVRALDPKHATPFARGAQAQGFRFEGGKLDDITVVVAFVTSATNL